MDSPPKANCLIVAPSSSPKLEESPSFHLFSDLSPLKSVKAQPHRLRFIHTNFSIPPPVFSSPRMGEREISIPKSTEMDAAESEVHVQCDSHLKYEIVQNFQKEEQAQSPSFYLVDPTEMEVNTSSSHLCVQQENDMSNILNSSMISRQDTIIRANNITESDMLLGPCFEAQCHEQYVPQMLQAADNHDNKVGDSYQSFPQSLQSAEAYNNSDQSSRQTSIGSFKGADQRHSGVSRHLHFGVTVDCKLTGNETHDAANSSSPAALPNVETMVPHHVESGGISSNWQGGSHAQTATFLATFCPSPSVLSTQDSVHDGSVCIPSGLGFPLSSITRSLSMGSDLTASNLAGNQNAQEERQVCDRNHSSAEDLDSISNSSATRDIYAQLEDYRQESQVTETVGSVNYPIISMQPPCDSLLLTPCEQRLVPYEGRTFTSPNPDTVKELNKASPKRNRKRAKHINDSEVCKNCNCKRSKCLKLYCECFAAGVYCLDSCACENCFNRPEYEDTVLGTREQIETRNPLAFAPKVVKLVASSPANMVEVGSWTTPSSGRHKRGCNCKKSKCLKKYCECYQAGVGCSTGCRCEGCNNSFGMKPESTYRRAEKWASPSHEQMDNLEAQDDFSKAGRAHQFSSKWEEFPGIGHLTPLSHHLSRPAASSASLNIGGHSKVSQAQVGNLQSSTVHYNSQYSSSNLTPKSPGRKVVSEVNSDGLFCDMLKDDAIPRILKNTSTPSKAVQRSSPNKKRVSPPQIQSQDLRSNSSKELRSSLKLKIPVVPSFPSLTPYSKLKDRDSKMDDDIKVRAVIGRDI